MKLGVKISENLVIKLSIIIDDDDMREPVLIDYQLSEETSNLAFSDIYEGFCLHLFDKVVNDDDKKLLLPRHREERTSMSISY